MVQSSSLKYFRRNRITQNNFVQMWHICTFFLVNLIVTQGKSAVTQPQVHLPWTSCPVCCNRTLGIVVTRQYEPKTAKIRPKCVSCLCLVHTDVAKRMNLLLIGLYGIYIRRGLNRPKTAFSLTNCHLMQGIIFKTFYLFDF